MKNLNNKILIGAFAVLVLIFVLTKFFRSPARESNIDGTRFRVDTAAIMEVRLLPQKDSLIETRIVRKENRWSAVRKDVEVDVPPYRIKNLLRVLRELKPDRIVTRKPEKWNDYQVSDSAASIVTVLSEKDELLKLAVGRESGGVTYVRASEDDEVYALEGNLQQAFNTAFKDWRDQRFLRLTKNTINRIGFRYPADSSFTLEKKNKVWMMENANIDSTQVDAFLTQISNKDHDVFADNFTSSKDPDVTVTIGSASNAGEVVVKAWRHSFYQWIFNSSLQPGVYFLDEGGMLSKDVLPGKRRFLD